MAIATSRAGRNLMAAGSDDERSQGGRHVPNDAPTVPSSVLDQDIAGRQHHLRAIVELECHVAGEKDPEIRRVSLVKAVVSSTGFVAILEVHLGSGFWCNHAGQVRPYDVADATYGWEYTGRRRIVPRVRVGCGLIGIPTALSATRRPKSRSNQSLLRCCQAPCPNGRTNVLVGLHITSSPDGERLVKSVNKGVSPVSTIVRIAGTHSGSLIAGS